jgi:hypothetical protein
VDIIDEVTTLLFIMDTPLPALYAFLVVALVVAGLVIHDDGLPALSVLIPRSVLFRRCFVPVCGCLFWKWRMVLRFDLFFSGMCALDMCMESTLAIRHYRRTWYTNNNIWENNNVEGFGLPNVLMFLL